MIEPLILAVGWPSLEWFWDEILSWLIFSVLAGAIAGKVGSHLEQRHNKDFEGWNLKIIHLDAPIQMEPLYSEDVKRYRASRFELFKMVKSNLINFGWWYVAPAGESPFSGEPAWIREEGKAFVIDLTLAKARNHIEEIKKGQRA